MSQYLPYNRFKRLKQIEIEGFDANLVGENSTCDYLLKVDLNIVTNYTNGIMIIR